MKTINLRVLYPDAYKSDYYVEVPDEVAEVFETFERMEKAYMQRVYYHKAYYTLDCSDEIEHSVVFKVLSPEEIYERKLRKRRGSAKRRLPIRFSAECENWRVESKSFKKNLDKA